MSHLPTTAAKVKILKKQAKRLGLTDKRKHVELLDVVAQSAGYHHWHHVVECEQLTAAQGRTRGILTEIDAIIDAELAGEVRLVVTGPEATTAQPFLLMATGIGDAWMLDPIKGQALCLVWHGERQPFTVRDLPTRIELIWDGVFELRGQFFFVDTHHDEIKSRTVAGYPIEQLRQFLNELRPVEETVDTIFNQADSVPLTPEIVQQLLGTGWSRSQLEEAARQGARYSPLRDSVLFPSVLENPD